MQLHWTREAAEDYAWHMSRHQKDNPEGYFWYLDRPDTPGNRALIKYEDGLLVGEVLQAFAGTVLSVELKWRPGFIPTIFIAFADDPDAEMFKPQMSFLMPTVEAAKSWLKDNGYNYE